MTLKKEKACLESVFRKTEKPLSYFWKTALYIQERASAAKERMKQLERQLKEQACLRARLARGPTPPEMIDIITSYVPTSNKLRIRRKFGLVVYVDGLLPHAIRDPSLLLPFYQKSFKSEWTLEDIANQVIKRTVLEEVSLKNYLKLRAEAQEHNIFDVSYLRPLVLFPHQWRKLDISVSHIELNSFIDLLKPCLPRLEELNVKVIHTATSGPITPYEDGRGLKTVGLNFNILSIFFNSGILDSITSLELKFIDVGQFSLDGDAFRKALMDMPRILSQLPCLRELTTAHIDCEPEDLQGLPKVASTSLRSLIVGGDSIDAITVFLNLFSNCRITCIDVSSYFLQEVRGLFGDIQRVCVDVSSHDQYVRLYAAIHHNFSQGYLSELFF